MSTQDRRKEERRQIQQGCEDERRTPGFCRRRSDWPMDAKLLIRQHIQVPDPQSGNGDLIRAEVHGYQPGNGETGPRYGVKLLKPGTNVFQDEIVWFLAIDCHDIRPQGAAMAVG